MRIHAKPLPISLDLFSANMQNIHAFFLHLSDIFHPEKIVFHTFISIMVILPYLHFHFFWRARQFYSHWISHLPSSSAPLEQVLKKQQCTTLAVTAACISNCFFVCLLLKASLKLSWLEGLCKNPYLTFHSSQIPDREDSETRRNMLFLLFPSFFSYVRKIWFFLSPTQSEVQSQLGFCILCRRLTRTHAIGWRMACHTRQAWFFTKKLFSSLAQLFVQGFQAPYLNSDKEIAIQC